MNPEIRREIRLNKKALAKIGRDDKAAYRQLQREHAQHEAAKRRIEIEIGRQTKRVSRATTKIENRLLILQGRLS